MADAAAGRLPALDSLRGVAALLVVTFHCWCLGLYTPPRGLHAHIWFWTPLNLAIGGRPPVILFFVLSGFVLACSLERSGSGGTCRFFIRRICRVYLPFVASLVFSVIAYDVRRPEAISGLSTWFNTLAWTSPPSIQLIATHLMMLGIEGSNSLNPVMWSLVYELRISLIFPLLFLLTRGWPKSSIAGAVALHVGAAALVGCNSIQCTPFRGGDLSQSFLLTGYFVIFFVTGIYLAQYRDLIRVRMRVWPAAATATLSAVGVYCLILPGTGSLSRFIPSDLAFGIGAALLIALSVGGRVWSRVLGHATLTHLGRISYSLYLTHNIVILALGHLLYGRVSDPALIVLMMATSIAAAEVFWRTVEAPSMRLGQRLTRGPVGAGSILSRSGG